MRGLFFSEIYRQVPTLEPPQTRYLPFSKYPVRSFMLLLIEAGRLAYPARAPDDSLRLLGSSIYDAFASSLAGLSMLSGADHDRALDMAPEAYRLSMDPAEVRVASRSPEGAVIEMRNVWVFPESFQLGTLQGALRTLGLQAAIDVIRHSHASADFHIRWAPR